MQIKKFVKNWILPLLRPRPEEQELLDRLNPQIAMTELPGPFDYAVGLGKYSIETFHKRSDMGTLIRMLKSDYSTAAADRLAELLIQFLESHPLPQKPDLVVTIPDSLTNRPFKPVAYLADQAADHFGWSARHDIIYPVRIEKPQRERSFKERMADLQPRYNLRHSDAVHGKSVLLFDDIFATGQSIIEAADLIREHSPAFVMALTLAKLG
jgi:predicted amidophosphoribosyltransferase